MVNGPFPLSVSTRPAARMAVPNVVKMPAIAAVSTRFCSARRRVVLGLAFVSAVGPRSSALDVRPLPFAAWSAAFVVAFIGCLPRGLDDCCQTASPNTARHECPLRVGEATPRHNGMRLENSGRRITGVGLP